jgi:hypothetical protein
MPKNIISGTTLMKGGTPKFERRANDRTPTNIGKK